jgi:flavin reductase
MPDATQSNIAEPGALFREGMSRVAAAVHIITTDGPHGKAGLTATAVSSLSAEPPMLLACVKRSASAAPLLQQNGVFVVNTLAAAHRELADLFAGRTGLRGAQRFETHDWVKGETGAPILPDALVSFECRVAQIIDVSTHDIIIGNVVGVRLGEKSPHLLYAARNYATL